MINSFQIYIKIWNNLKELHLKNPNMMHRRKANRLIASQKGTESEEKKSREFDKHTSVCVSARERVKKETRERERK